LSPWDFLFKSVFLVSLCGVCQKIALAALDLAYVFTSHWIESLVSSFANVGNDL